MTTNALLARGMKKMGGPANSDSAGDDLLVSEDLVEAPEYTQARTGTIDFDGQLSTPLCLHQDLTNGNGGQAWPAGMILSKYLLRTKRDMLRASSMFVALHRGLYLPF